MSTDAALESHQHLSRGRRRLLALPPGQAPVRFGFRLTTANIAASIPPRVPGSYILLANGAVTYVGRSDRCLRTRLTTHPLRGTATYFCATVADSPRQAYLFESYWWHRYTRDGAELINRIHPAAPNAVTPCPFCGVTAASRPNNVESPAGGDAPPVIDLRQSPRARALTTATATNL